MTAIGERSPVPAFVLQEAGNIANGADVILRSLAIKIVDGSIDCSDPAGATLITARLEELIPAVQQHWMTVGSAVVGCHTPTTQQYRDRLIYRSRDIFLANFSLLRDLGAHVREVRKAQECLGDVSLVVVAGHQASGKDSTSPVFAKLGFSPVTMSDAVRDTASAWQLDRDAPEEKIVVGRVLRDYFGDGILVSLAVMQAVLAGENRLVLFGPRVMGEVDEALRMGGVLIGVRVHENPQVDRDIRRSRIASRSAKDSNRAGDMKMFDQRERIEGPIIEQMLLHPRCHRIFNNSSVENFEDSFKNFVVPLLAESFASR